MLRRRISLERTCGITPGKEICPRRCGPSLIRRWSPPALEPVPQRLRVVWMSPEGEELVLADTTAGYRVLETRYAVQVRGTSSIKLTKLRQPPTNVLHSSRGRQNIDALTLGKVVLLRGKLQRVK